MNQTDIDDESPLEAPKAESVGMSAATAGLIVFASVIAGLAISAQHPAPTRSRSIAVDSGLPGKGWTIPPSRRPARTARSDEFLPRRAAAKTPRFDAEDELASDPPFGASIGRSQDPLADATFRDGPTLADAYPTTPRPRGRTSPISLRGPGNAARAESTIATETAPGRTLPSQVAPPRVRAAIEPAVARSSFVDETTREPSPSTADRAPRSDIAPATWVVRDGDTLRSIAEQVWNDGDRWRTIWILNRDRLVEPETLPVGAELRLGREDGDDEIKLDERSTREPNVREPNLRERPARRMRLEPIPDEN